MSFGKPLLTILQNKGLPLKIMVAAFLLIGVEEVLEHHYKCPISVALRKVYISLYFIIPSFALLVLGVYCQIHLLKLPAKSRDEKCHIFLWALFLALFWTVILLSDGKYVACACNSVGGNNTTQIAPEGSNADIASKITGLILFLIIFIVNCCYIKRYYKKMMEDLRSEEVPKWEAEGQASYTSPEYSGSETRNDISFHCVLTKPSPSRGTKSQNTEEERLVHPKGGGGGEVEMSPQCQSSPSVAS